MTTPQTAVEVLIAARELISVPERWTQGRYTSTNETGQACWCGVGAVYEVGDSDPDSPIYRQTIGARFLLDRVVGVLPYIPWQDAPNRTHAEVLAAFDRAIEIARAEEA